MKPETPKAYEKEISITIKLTKEDIERLDMYRQWTKYTREEAVKVCVMNMLYNA
jgi:hypothetical protein